MRVTLVEATNSGTRILHRLHPVKGRERQRCEFPVARLTRDGKNVTS